jgi:RNA polymerase sigma factor (sigma-70 family)
VQTTIYKTDSQLIREYVESKSQAAFTELAVRHASWVYSCALRQVRDPHLAEDVAQAVFIILPRKAPTLAENTTLNAWLFKVTRYAAGHVLRAGARRQRHERTAASMMPEISTADADSNWNEIEPSLDDLVSHLEHEDRQAVLLRFYQQKTMADVGAALSVTEDTAKKRVARAVDRLRNMLRRNGVTIPAAGLATTLIAATTRPASANLLASCAAASTTTTSVAAMAIAKQTISAMFAAKLKLCIAALLFVTLIPVAGVGTYLLYKESDSPAAATSAAPAVVASLDDSRESKAALDALQGKWTNTVLMLNGTPADVKDGISTLVIFGDQATLSHAKTNESVVMKRIDTLVNPPHIDFVQDGKISEGIFLLDRDHLKMCWSMVGDSRPGVFESHAGDNRRLAEFDRETTSAASNDKEMIEKLQGTWASISVLAKGKAAPADQQHGTVVIAGSTVNELGSPPSHARALTIDASHTPAWINIASGTGAPTLGIIEIQDDQFQMCWTDPGGVRPTEFTTSATDGRWIGRFKRQPMPK